MIESLFPRYWPRYVSGPYGNLVRDFANWAMERRYTRHCAKGHVRRFRAVLEEGSVAIGPGQPISSRRLARCFATWSNDSYYRGTHRLAQQFLASAGLLISRERLPRFHSVLAAYRSYLVDQRGLSSSTVRHHMKTAVELLNSTCRRSHSLAELSREAVERFVDRTGKRIGRHTLQHTIAHLRSFLRFCAHRGLIKDRLEPIDAPRAYRGELPPRALPWGIVRRLLASIDRSTPDGCRDHAILFLMAHYGLRPCEVADLTIESINWSGSTLRIEQRKTRSVVIMPVDNRTLQVLRLYLRQRDRRPWRELFLRLRCPAGPIKASTISDIYENRARRSGLPIEGSSSYCLRHSFAMRLLERGVGVKAIGDLLGHNSLESTCVYLRLHAVALREAALPLPHGLRGGRLRDE